MIHIHINQNRITAIAADGGILSQGIAGKEDAAVIQHAVDSLLTGGMIMLGVGRYRLDKPVKICAPVTLCGEGAGTEVMPPAGDFAIKVYYDGRCPDRCLVSFKVPPVHAKPGVSWEAGNWWGKPKRLHGVHIRDLAIQGDGRGKGVFLSCLTESSLRDLWIMNTADGAALYLDREVMECEFENLHLSNCGSPASREAVLVLNSQTGGDCLNNLHFRGIYVIFPQYIGIEIGCREHPGHPRQIWFQHCMLHGWQCLASPAPYDLIRINATHPGRGVSFASSRIGMGQKDNDPGTCHFRVCQGSLKLDDCVVGGGCSDWMLEAGAGSDLMVTRTAFHGSVGCGVLKSRQAEVLFAQNHVEIKGGDTVLEVAAPTSARIIDNTFKLATGQNLVNVTDSPEQPSGYVAVNGNFITGSTRPLQLDLQSGLQAIEMDNRYRGQP